MKVDISKYQANLILDALSRFDIYTLSVGEYMEFATLIEKLELKLEAKDEQGA